MPQKGAKGAKQKRFKMAGRPGPIDSESYRVFSAHRSFCAFCAFCAFLRLIIRSCLQWNTRGERRERLRERFDPLAFTTNKKYCLKPRSCCS